MKTIQFTTVAGLILATAFVRADVVDTFTNVDALQWDTTNTAPSKTVHFTGTNTGVGFDITLSTNQGNLVTGDYKPGGVSYLSDSGGINGMGWFEGALNITANNFTGAAPGNISFQLVDVSGRKLATNAINFTSTATPTTTTIVLGPNNNDAAFSNVAFDTSAANMAAGWYLATLPWKNMDPESSGLFRYFSFQVSTVTSVLPYVISIIDDHGGATVAPGTLVTYTVTFSEDMDSTTVDATDFGNAGSPAATIGAVAETTPGVFTVAATPTAEGTLRLRINAGAELKNPAEGVAVDTTNPILDDTTLTVMAPDTVAPTPNPATFAVAPTADNSAAISMTATTGTDPSGPVQYLFTETTGHPGGASSSWQTSPTYTNTGLQPSTQYTYTVTMRDSLGNTGTASASASATTQAPQSLDTFTNQSTLAWDTVNTSPSKTVHIVCPNSGVEFDLTLATNAGNLVASDYKPDMLADSGGFNGTGWFEGTLTVTANNFTGAAPGDISFQLLNVSGRRLVTDTINFTSTATPTTTPILLGTPWNTDAPFTNIALDSTPANMAGGQYVATLAWKNMDVESSGLYSSFGFQVNVTSTQTGPPPQITSITPVGGGVWELTFAGQPNTGYQFRSSATLTFNPGKLVENLTQGNPGVDPGTIGGTNNSAFTTNGSGNATVRVMLTGFPADFVRAQSAP